MRIEGPYRAQVFELVGQTAKRLADLSDAGMAT
jgi:hypothetical protein